MARVRLPLDCTALGRATASSHDVSLPHTPESRRHRFWWSEGLVLVAATRRTQGPACSPPHTPHLMGQMPRQLGPSPANPSQSNTSPRSSANPGLSRDHWSLPSPVLFLPSFPTTRFSKLLSTTERSTVSPLRSSSLLCAWRPLCPVGICLSGECIGGADYMLLPAGHGWEIGDSVSLRMRGLSLLDRH